MDTNKDDVMDAEQILVELRKLSAKEHSENEPTAEKDAALLDDAIASIEKFVEAEKEEPSDESQVAPEKPEGVVDTGILTGPINGLKNFLIKKSQDNQSY